jgi:hypothetical protein
MTLLLAFGLGVVFLFLFGLQVRMTAKGTHRAQIALVTFGAAALQGYVMAFVLVSPATVLCWAAGNALGIVLSTYLDSLW